MNFKISRASMWAEAGKPCEEAIRIMVPRYESRTCSEAEFDSRFAATEGTWRSKGSEHSIDESLHIVRRLSDEEVWGVVLNNLEDLIQLSKKYGDIVFDGKRHCCIIYDDYLE